MTAKEDKKNLNRLESKYKLLYFLRDIGIKSAHKPAVDSWLVFMNSVGLYIDNFEDQVVS